MPRPSSCATPECPAYAVLRARDLRSDPQLVAREFYIELDHSETWAACVYDGAVTQFSATPMRADPRRPDDRQHTWEVSGRYPGLQRG